MLKSMFLSSNERDAKKVLIDNVIRLPDADSGLTHSIVRFDNSRVGASGHANGKFARRRAVKITNTDTKRWILRYVMGNGGTVKGLKRNCIAIDYDGIVDLGIAYNQPVSIHIQYANWLDTAIWFWDYPELNIRWSFRLGAIGLLLGVISIADLALKAITG